MSLPILYPCERPHCRRLSHLRYCPEHADKGQIQAQKLLDEVRLRLDVARHEPRDDTDRAIRDHLSILFR
jgi:hypothetical protein